MAEKVAKTTLRDLNKDSSTSALHKYRIMVMGDVGWGRLVLFELCNLLFGPIPGALGLFLRRKAFPFFFGACGRNVIIGRSCTFRYPGRILLGDNVVLDEYCCLDARNATRQGLILGNNVVVNRMVALRGDIRIGDGVNIGSSCHVNSRSGVFIEDGVSIAAGCFINAGTYDLREMSKPVSERVSMSAGPIRVGRNAWLATSVTLLDAVEVGEGTVVAAGSVVNHNIPARSVAQGNPARVIFTAH